MNERYSAGRTLFVIQVIFVESDVLKGQRRTDQWTRSHVIHIQFSYVFSEMVARGRSCGKVLRSCIDWVGGFWLLLSYFPTGKRLFSTQIVETSSGLHPASYPADARVFSEKLMVVHLRKKLLFLTKRSSASKYLKSVQPLKPCSLKIHCNIILISI